VNWPTDFLNKIICGDCLEIMRQMPDESVDLCIADPPFNVGKNYGKTTNDKQSHADYWAWLKDRLIEIYRLLKENSRLYIFHTDIGVFQLKPLCELIGFRYSQTLIWYGPNLVGSRGRISKDWHCMHENILLFYKGKRTPMLSTHESNCYSVQVCVRPQSNFKGGRDHPAQKPSKLLNSLISRSPGQVILFPFLGSGVDTRAAKDHHRDFVGIEINSDYCEIAEERLAQGVL